MKIVTGFSVIKTVDGTRLSYTLTEKDENGVVLRSNIRKSTDLRDIEMLGKVSELENFILSLE